MDLGVAVGTGNAWLAWSVCRIWYIVDIYEDNDGIRWHIVRFRIRTIKNVCENGLEGEEDCDDTQAAANFFLLLLYSGLTPAYIPQ